MLSESALRKTFGEHSTYVNTCGVFKCSTSNSFIHEELPHLSYEKQKKAWNIYVFHDVYACLKGTENDMFTVQPIMHDRYFSS